MKIALAFLGSLAAAALAGWLFSLIETWGRTADMVFVAPVAFAIFAGGIALAWAPWFLIARKG